METLDSNGKTLNNWDTVQPIKDLPVKWSSQIFKKWEAIKKIYLTDDPEYIKIKWGIFLKAIYLKKENKKSLFQIKSRYAICLYSQV